MPLIFLYLPLLKLVIIFKLLTYNFPAFKNYIIL